MGKTRIQKRTNINPFVKYVNLNHVMPTRYAVGSDFDLRDHVKEEKLISPETKGEVKKALKVAL